MGVLKCDTYLVAVLGLALGVVVRFNRHLKVVEGAAGGTNVRVPEPDRWKPSFRRIDLHLCAAKPAVVFSRLPPGSGSGLRRGPGALPSAHA